MSDPTEHPGGYCEKHFIRYCIDLSKKCPYCRIETLGAEVARLQESQLAKDYDALLKRDTDNLKRLIACQAELEQARDMNKEAQVFIEQKMAQIDTLKAELEQAQATLERIKKLPDKWRRNSNNPNEPYWAKQCADELEGVINNG